MSTKGGNALQKRGKDLEREQRTGFPEPTSLLLTQGLHTLDDLTHTVLPVEYNRQLQRVYDMGATAPLLHSSL